jgi:hypothetical protein
MFSVAKNVIRVPSRAFLAPSGRAFKHTLRALPYAYDVSSVSTLEGY